MAPKFIALSQRVDIVSARGERRDALDQRWYEFLAACGFAGAPIPNHAQSVPQTLAALNPAGIVLTGGNDLADLGGDAPERDAAERAMLAWAAERKVPVLGVCRGLQMILHGHGGKLKKVPGHVGSRHRLTWQGRAIEVNSYHTWGADSVPADFDITARSDDGLVEAVRHRSQHVAGIMWHPEREASFAAHDIELFRATFGG